MTTDDTALINALGDALAGHRLIEHSPGAGEHLELSPQACVRLAAAVLPIIRKAQADAWDEGQESGWGSAREESDQHGGVCDMWKPHVWLEPNPYRTEQNR